MLKPLSRYLNLINLFFLFAFTISSHAQENQNTIIDQSFSFFIDAETLGRTPIGGDTLFIDSNRTTPLKFFFLEGEPSNPIVIINKGGQVNIDGVPGNIWGALTFENCKHIKLSGAGHPEFKYGFQLSAASCGLAFAQLSTDCEAEFIKVSHNGFFGIVAKKDYGGNPPSPYPVFDNLIIHDCFVENVSEGMYIGETQSPGMEFKNLKIYNNIVRNTQMESIQIANAVENAEIYNNTLINSGLGGVTFQTNNLQIGDNCEVMVYNNIIKDAPDFGIINFGKGDVLIFNNYIENNKGIFCDDRSFADPNGVIDISNNYFRNLISNAVITNLNEINNFIAIDNLYNIDIDFYNDQNLVDNETFTNNTLVEIEEIQFVDISENNYALIDSSPIEYFGVGAPGGPEYFSTTLDVNENRLNNNITLYPNPTEGIINLESNFEIKFIDVFNISGQKVSRFNTGNINIADYSDGVYIFKITGYNNETRIKRVLKG